MRMLCFHFPMFHHSPFYTSIVMNAYLLTVGDEILIGQIVDTNAAWMAQQLNLQGTRIVGKSSVPDQHEAIVESIRYATSQADLVLMTGGLGATKDDITKKALAACYGVEMTMHQATLDRMTFFFTRMKREVTEMNRLGCLMPTNAQIMTNERGLAPAMWFEQNGKILVSMPGVPFEMMHLMTDKVLPKLREQFPVTPIVHRTILTAGEGETMLSEKIADFEDNLPTNVKLAYLPSIAQVRLRLTAVGEDENALNVQIEQLQSELVGRLGNAVFGYGEDTLSAAVGRMLKVKNLTLATAESCTGGYLAHLITEVSGASEYFMGSIVAYDNAVKMKQLHVLPETLDTHGAVSEATVRQMVAGALDTLGVDIAVATSGIAGPTGGTPEKAVGTVWIAVGNATQTHAFSYVMDRGRAKNIEYAANNALNAIRRFILLNYA
jgi:nicotinamide-nucleotide amidase